MLRLGRGVDAALQFMNARGRGVMRGGKEEQFHGRQITMGAQNHCVGRRKGPTMSQVHSSRAYRTFASKRPQVRTWGRQRQTCQLSRPPSNLVPSLAWGTNKGSRNCTWRFQFLPNNYCAPRQSGAHCTCHACHHTLDTPLNISNCDYTEVADWRV